MFTDCGDNYRQDYINRDNYGQDNYGRDNYSCDNYGQDNYGYNNYGQENCGYNIQGQENYGYNNYAQDSNCCNNYQQDNYGYANQENAGHSNTGHDNYGYSNTGHDNYGHENTGHDNTGYGVGDDKKKDSAKKQGDFGPQPFVVNINCAARNNKFYRTTLWTGTYLQLTLMSIMDEIGLEVHHDTDQFIRVEEGYGLVMMGSSPDNLSYRMNVNKNTAIFVPAGTWHNVVNCGPVPLKLYAIYAPPHHKPGTIHYTRKDAMEAEH